MIKIVFTFSMIAFLASAMYAQNGTAAAVDYYPSPSPKTIKTVSKKPEIALNSNSYDAGSAVWMQIDADHLLRQKRTGLSVKVYFSENSHLDFGDKMLEHFTAETLDFDESGFLSLQFLLPDDIATGRHHLIVCVQTEEGSVQQHISSTSIWILGE
jgi:hypothetical protein